MGPSADHLSVQTLSGQYAAVLTSEPSEAIILQFVHNLLADEDVQPIQDAGNSGHGSGKTNTATISPIPAERAAAALAVGFAAFNAFLQVNVTGPVLDGADRVEAVFAHAVAAQNSDSDSAATTALTNRRLAVLRRACLQSLDVDGVSVYPYAPHVELFCLARTVLAGLPAAWDELRVRVDDPAAALSNDDAPSVQWLLWRVHVWHYKLLTPPSAGPGSIGAFSRATQWTDVPALRETIERGMATLEEAVLRKDDKWDAADRARFLLEKAGVCAMLGQDGHAREALRRAAEVREFAYALSGALGKRTRFQEKSTSQLVVLAKSAEWQEQGQGRGQGREQEEGQEGGEARPQTLELNDDTLLEKLEFTKENGNETGNLDEKGGLPAALRDLAPDEQPQLAPLDQAILLAEASLKDAFSPVDSLTSEEILPFAVRVIDDRSTNWQIYTQALLVRSRIEVHRSRTVERGVLQMQAVVDQVVVDTTSPTPRNDNTEDSDAREIPSIQLTTAAPCEMPLAVGEEKGRLSRSAKEIDKPTSFFPAPQPAETAPAHVRLQYIHVLNSPPRWHLESELAFSWAGVGSLVSALEIFKRLRLWAEVALCLASSATAGDEDGRGSGGEEKARAVLRWQLFHRTSTDPSALQRREGALEPDEEGTDIDVSALNEADYHGPERHPPPPNAPRLLCILGDIEDEPRHYERAWGVSGQRFARAQRSLGEYRLRRKDWAGARDAYRQALAVNRLSADMWNRLGDICLRLGDFGEAAEAFGRAIAAAGDAVGGEDARTWSNLGSALYSLYVESLKEARGEGGNEAADEVDEGEGEIKGEEEEDTGKQTSSKRDSATLLAQALAAYKRGASISQDNWRIWDNVLTLAARLRPPAVPDMLLALRSIVRLRSSEDALDVDVIRLLLDEAVLSRPRPGPEAQHNLAHGSTERAVCDFLEHDVAPLITMRSELWELVARERVWRRDYAGAIDAGERAWRAAVGSGGGGLLAPGPAASSGGAESGKNKNWLEDKEAWRTVVERTDELVSLLENYGPDVADIGARWKGKARSAVRSVLGKAREAWEGSEEWTRLEGILEGLRS